MLIKVTKDNNPAFYWFDITELNIGVARGQKAKFTKSLQTPYGSVDSPTPPLNVKWQYTDETNQTGQGDMGHPTDSGLSIDSMCTQRLEFTVETVRWE